MNWLIALALLLPLVSLAALARPRLLAPALALAPLPLVLLGAIGDAQARLPLMLLGSEFATDAVNRPLLLLAGVGWSLAGAFVAASVDERRRSFCAFWLLALAGQCAALLGGDLASFYLGYVVMTLAAYGLVVHERSGEAWRAGRVYLVLALAGEALILSGLLMLGARHGNADFASLYAAPPAVLPSILLLIGFAVKLGVVPLHVWLPLAHPVAPVPASAVLSGVLVKAGLLGMLRFVPAEMLPAPDLLLAIGLFTAAFGALVGLAQTRLKTVLAYSTVSQMGLAFAGLAGTHAAGAGALAALGLFAAHHGLNKIALFLAAGHRVSGRLAWLLFLLPAASLAGLPFTSGALAKLALKDALDTAGAGPWLVALSLSSVLTTMLLLHAFALARARVKGRANAHPAWIGAVAAGVLLPWWLAADATRSYAFGFAPIFDALWPIVLGAIAYAALRRLLPRLRMPEGDLVVLMEAAARRPLGATVRIGAAWGRWEPRAPDFRPDREKLRHIESQLGHLPIAGLCMLLILVCLALI
jgi:formate hydrogenlyase subunit 3/multisubunit Na+/H+ antiporter MnhD subunit